MPRSIVRPSSPKTKVLLVRQAVKSVRRSDEADLLPLRLAIGVIATLGGTLSLWLMGHIGFRLGFAPIMGTPDLLAEPGGGLVTGVLMLIAIPEVILRCGMQQPLWLMLAFVLIAIPGAGLSAARPAVPGGPKPNTLTVTFSAIGAIAAGLNAMGMIWWTASPTRHALIYQLPFRPAQGEGWLLDLQTAAGLDVLAVIVAALWVVLSLRLAIPVWARALASTASIFALVVAVVAMSISNATVAQIQTGRSVCLLDDGPNRWLLLLGSTREYTVLFDVTPNAATVQLRDRPAVLTAIGTRSVIEVLDERASADDQP